MAATRSRPSPDLAATCESRLRGWLAPGQRLCVALSGGRDSVALLHLAAAAAPRIGLDLSALHVDHGLSPNARRWAEFCAVLCADLGVPLAVSRVSVNPRSGEGIEAAARRVRYAAFAEIAADAIALAHHAGDQAETLLFRLLRGTGVAGAAAMPMSRTVPRASGGALTLIRPLLDVPPEAIAGYVAAQRLRFVSDESNADPAYSRNYLRHAVLAPLDRRFPGASERLAQAAARFREAGELLDALAEVDAKACAGVGGVSLVELRSLSPERQRNLLRYWLREAGLMISSAYWLEELRVQLVTARDDAETMVGVGGFAVHAWRGEAFVVATPAAGPLPARPWQGEPRLAWAGGEVRFETGVGDGIAAAQLDGRVVMLRPRQGGERLQPDPKRPRRSLKHWLREARIPPWQRAVLPCLWCADQLVWVPGIGVDAAYAAGDGEPAWRVVWCPRPSPGNPPAAAA